MPPAVQEQDPSAVSAAPGSASSTRTALGLVTYCFTTAAKYSGSVARAPNFKDPLVFIEEAARMGAGAVQIPFGICGPEKVRTIRELAERESIAMESTVSLPRDATDLNRFEAELKTLSALGVQIARTVLLPGRRYEQFKSVLDYAAAMRRGIKALSDAEKIARRYDIRLALENHKDHTLEERLALLEQFSSEYIGACLDVGNNIALLEDSLEVARAFAPWTLTVHFKDQGVREYEDGFLLADVPLGQGAIDLAEVIEVVREQKPKVRFHLELITRDPLKIPYLREDYWTTLETIKARHLGGTMAMLKKRSAAKEFPVVSKLDPAAQVAAERRNVEESFGYAAQKLGF